MNVKTSTSSIRKQTEICRLCLGLGLTATCCSLVEDTKTSTMLEALTSLRILPSDDISTVMCLKCCLNLKLAFTIQQKMLRAEQRFREHRFFVPVKQEHAIEHTEPEILNKEKFETSEPLLKLDDQKTDNVEYICNICGKARSSKTDLINHKRTAHEEADCPVCGKTYKRGSLKGHIYNKHGKTGEIHTCDICGVEKRSKIQLYRHKKAVHQRTKCPICDKDVRCVFLKTHLATHPCTTEEYVCDICGKKTSSQMDLDNHKKSTHEEADCPVCGKTYKKGSLKSHIYTKHGKTGGIHICDICGAEKSSKPQLYRHKRAVHQRTKCTVCDKDVRCVFLKRHLETHNPPITKQEYVCDICNKPRQSKEALRLHKRGVHMEGECPICKKKITRTNLKRHIERHTNPQTVCDLCGMSVLQQDLRVHVYNNHTVRQLKCSFCDKIFKRHFDRKVHEKNDHLGEAAFVCDTCGKTFSRKGLLKQHVTSTHLKLRPHICEFCNVGFSSKFALKTHTRQHTNERPFKCEFCAEGFKQNVSLKSHLKSQHGVEEELSCECKDCGKKFASNVALVSHRRIHQ